VRLRGSQAAWRSLTPPAAAARTPAATMQTYHSLPPLNDNAALEGYGSYAPGWLPVRSTMTDGCGSSSGMNQMPTPARRPRR
jgi:hypothetical protein